MIKPISAALVSIALLTGCGFDNDLAKVQDVVVETCKRDGGQLFLGASVSVWGASSVNLGCLYPVGTYPKREVKKQ